MTIDDHERGGRLREARKKRPYATADAAADALGISRDTYRQHENGTRGFKRQAERYATFFRVSLDWLWTGRGEMQPGAGVEPLDAEAVELAKAFGRAPAGVQRIIEGILRGSRSLTDAERRSLEAPDVAYEQPEPDAPLSLQDSPPERPRGLPIDKTDLDQKAVDAALARPPKGSAKRKRK